LLDRTHDEIHLFELIINAEINDLQTTLTVRPQPLVFPIPILADNSEHRIENHLNKSIILLKTHNTCLTEVLLEVQNVTQIGTPPLINKLIRITHNNNVAMNFNKTANQQILQTIDILVLVHHHVLKLPNIKLAHLLEGFEELNHLQQKVIEVERVNVLENLQIPFINLHDLLIANIPPTTCDRNKHLAYQRQIHDD